MLNVLDIFDVEEQAVINRSVQNENVNSFTRDAMMKKIDFVIAISNDDDVQELYEGLKSKIVTITDDEWGNICSLLPYDLPYSDEDVPVDDMA
jgi:MinD superfamily P-loop ATPase